MNGQERAEQSFKVFEAWVSSKTDVDFREMATHGGLNRGEICRECNFGRSALIQNPRIKEALSQLEERLRTAGVLPQHSTTNDLPMRARGQLEASSGAERLKKLEAENAGLRAGLAELRKRLSRFVAVQRNWSQLMTILLAAFFEPG